MSIPAVGPSFPLGNSGVANAANAANAAQNAATAAQNAQAAVNNAAANMGAAVQQNLSATGMPIPQNSAAIANIVAGLASAQNTSEAATGKPNPASAQSNASPATQLLPNTGTSGTNLDSALQNSRSAWQNAAGQAATQKGGANPDSLARMLQTFSQSTVSPGTVQTSLGRAQIIPPGQGANLYAAAQNSGAVATGNPATTANPASAAGAANPGTAAAGTAAQSALPTPASAAARANTAAPATSAQAAATQLVGAQTTTQTAAGAATLRAEGAQTQAAPAPATPAGTPASAPGGPAVPAALPEAAVRQANVAQANVQQAVAQAAASASEGKTTAAHPQNQARNAAVGPDANPAPALPAPMTPQDPAPKAGQLGTSVSGVSEDPMYMSQVAAASGFGAKLQQSLNLNLGIANLTAGNLISFCGVLVITLVIMRVFVDGVVPEEIVALSFAAIIGIMLMIGPWLMRGKPGD